MNSNHQGMQIVSSGKIKQKLDFSFDDKQDYTIYSDNNDQTEEPEENLEQ